MQRRPSGGVCKELWWSMQVFGCIACSMVGCIASLAYIACCMLYAVCIAWCMVRYPKTCMMAAIERLALCAIQRLACSA